MSIWRTLRSPGRVLRPGLAHLPDAPVLRLRGVSLRYETGAALEHVSFEMPPAERMAVVGPNGAGKSTLFKLIAGVTEPSEGQVEIAGIAPGEHICVAYVPQRSLVDWDFPVTVFDTVLMGRIGRIGLLRSAGQSDREIARQALELVGLEGLAGRQIGQLSGGQQQRMFIARALAQEAELVLMDEPFTGLDVTSQEQIFQILDNLRERRVTVLVALHDLDLAARRFDRVMLLNRRIVGLGAPAEIFTPERLLEAYGGRMRQLPGLGEYTIDDGCCGQGEEHEHA